jgi:hypothetical protein
MIEYSQEEEKENGTQEESLKWRQLALSGFEVLKFDRSLF